ncbi:hypothetical protein Droror1_Dr00001690 [Drosera rotundifolia]
MEEVNDTSTRKESSRRELAEVDLAENLTGISAITSTSFSTSQPPPAPESTTTSTSSSTSHPPPPPESTPSPSSTPNTFTSFGNTTTFPSFSSSFYSFVH